MNIYARYALILMLFAAAFTCKAETRHAEADSIRLSLLTCTPGEEIYTLFGHTAIRYEHPQKGIDVIFNYGIFSFDSPNFVWRFVKGETDYALGLNRYEDFEGGYSFYDRGIVEQTLNLTGQEKQKLLQLLTTNYEPQNRIYRYNFLYDNCATRPRDKIEEAIDGRIIYRDTVAQTTFRKIIHEHSKGYDWEKFGMDFCLGAQADRIISFREEMFAPYYLEKAFASAQITNGTETRPLVSETRVLVEEEAADEPGGTPFTPMRTFLLLFILTASATAYGIKKEKSLWGIDLLLFLAAGVAGSVIFFLSVFSEHPAVSQNYLILVFHPLHLFFLPFVLRKEMKRKRSWFHVINFSVLTLFILLWWAMPQHFNLAVLPLALCLLVRSASNLILTYKKRS